MIDLSEWGFEGVPATQWQADSRPARVVRVDRGECDVVSSAGHLRVLSDSHRAQGETAPVTGDWVELEEEDGLGTVIGRILPRRSRISRRDPAERDIEQILASNVDRVAVVHGLDRPLPAGRLERLLVIALDSGGHPLVVLTKTDDRLDNDTETVVRSVARDVPVVLTSTVEPDGLDDLVSMMAPTKTLALVGASGVGKSSLVNALAGDEILETGEVRDSDAKGRHTTTARELILLPEDRGLLLDTPGIRSVGLWEAEHALEVVFDDLMELADQCRFRDCLHDREPGCAITEQAGRGSIDRYRVQRFRDLTAELAQQRHREEQRSRKKPKGRRRPR